MTIIHGWDTSGLMHGRRSKTINIKTLSDAEKGQIKAQHDRAMIDIATWPFFGGVVNLGHRHFQVAP